MLSSRSILTAAVVISFLCIGCARPPDLIGVDNTARPVAATPGIKTHKILIATTRAGSADTGVLYSRERELGLRFASAVVSVPPTHKKGEIERAKRLPPDPARQFTVIDPEILNGETGFVAAIDRELARRSPQDRSVLLFVHGFNNTMSDSILRMGQFVNDTGFRGVPVMFAWASAGRVTEYVYDLNSALAARNRLIEVTNLVGRTNTRGIDIFAHSMGAFLTFEAIVREELKGAYDRTGRIQNVMLAAPDIDINVFREQLSNLPRRDRNIYVFVSEDDEALRASEFIAGGVVRLGQDDDPSLASLGITVIDLTKVGDTSHSAHSKFAASPEVVQLIGNGLKSQLYSAETPNQTLEEVLDKVPGVRVLTQ